MSFYEFWYKTSGTWLNVGAIIFGTACGLFLGHRLSLKLQTVITQAVGLVIIFLGQNIATNLLKVKTKLGIDGIVIALICLVVGGLWGEWAQLEAKIQQTADLLKQKIVGSSTHFSQGLVSATLLFCIGPMAILGSLDNGLRGDHTILGLKSLLDGITSVAFASSLGIGVGFSALPLLLYQGSLSLLAGSLGGLAQSPSITLISGLGGLLLLGLGLNLLEIGKLPITAFLPSLVLVPLVWWLLNP
ncbi:MAG: DUF554 domain-containing protein [Pseudanabaenaceae cyanobacterium bins.68]|nr:DUF554 domain-containing protein [Pseudanabaenaceae cyanobacterium bins.68]